MKFGRIVLQIKYTSFQGAGFLIWRHTFKMVASMSFWTEKCCHLVSARATFTCCIRWLPTRNFVYSSWSIVHPYMFSLLGSRLHTDRCLFYRMCFYFYRTCIWWWQWALQVADARSSQSDFRVVSTCSTWPFLRSVHHLVYHVSYLVYHVGHPSFPHDWLLYHISFLAVFIICLSPMSKCCNVATFLFYLLMIVINEGAYESAYVLHQLEVTWPLPLFLILVESIGYERLKVFGSIGNTRIFCRSSQVWQKNRVLLKGKGSVWLLMEFHLTATECHLPYGITQCYLPPVTSEHTSP